MDEVVSLSWNNYSASFLENLKSFQNKECLCDSTIACQGKFYPVHRLVLSLCSDYFKNIFERTPCKHPFIIVKDIEAIQLEALLNFIYQGEVDLSNKDLNDFMKAAEALKINGLLQNSHTVNSTSNANYYKLSNNYLNLTYKQKNPTVNELHSSKNYNLNEKLCPVSTNVAPISVPINLNIPTYVKKSIKSAKRSNNKKRPKAKSSVKSKRSNSLPRTKPVRKNAKKVKRPIAPLRKSSRESVPKVSYFIPDEEIEEPDSEIPISRENGTSQITIASYSGRNGEEFDDSQIISDQDVENITIKVESTDYILDDISDYPHPDLVDETIENINSHRTEPSSELFAALSSQDYDKDINYQPGEFNNHVTNMVLDAGKQSLAPAMPSTLKKVCKRKKKHPSKRSVISSGVSRPDYVCPFCGKCCLMKSLYLCHLRKHTGERPFACPHCDYKATQKHHIKGHIERRHKELCLS